MKFKDSILKYGSFVFVLLVPIAYWSHALYPHISSKTFFIYAFTEILFFVWLYALIVDRSYRLQKKTVLYFLPATTFVLWMTLCSIWGVNPSLSFWSSIARGTGLLTLYHCFALSIVVVSIVQKNGMTYVESLFKYFIAGATLGAFSVWLGPGGFGLNNLALTTGGEGGLVGNSSLAAMYMTFALCFCFFLFFKKDFNGKSKFGLIFSIITIIFSPLFINLCGLFNGYGLLGSARASVLALPVIILVAGVLYFLFSDKKILRNMGIVGSIIGVLLFAFFWIQLVTPGTQVHDKFEQEARGSRFIFWGIASKAMDQSPLTGYGPENYSYVFQKNFNPDSLLTKNSQEGWDDRAHNIYYELGVSGGYPAILLYCLFLIGVLYSIYKIYKIGKINRLQAVVLCAMIIGYVFQDLFIFDSNLSLMAVFLFSGIIFSSYIDSSNLNNQKIENKKIKYILFFALSPIFVFIFILFVFNPWQKIKLYAEYFAFFLSQNQKDYSLLFNGSTIGKDWDVSALAYDSYRIYLDKAKELKSNKDLNSKAVENLNSLLKYLYAITTVNKTDYRLYMSIAYLENTLTYLTDRPYDVEVTSKNLDILKKAKELSPTNPNVYWGIAQTKIWSRDFKGAETAYREAMVIAPRLPGSYSLFLKYAQALGNKRLFDEVMAKAKENIPNFVLN